jgi:ribose transport system ATP-binding protein
VLVANEITIRNLEKSFAGNRVLRGIDLTFRPGEVTGLMGANGAGKSTLIKILDGIYTADAGTVDVDGRPVPSLADLPEVGFIHQDLGLIDALPVTDNLRLGGASALRAGVFIRRDEERKRARVALDRVGLSCSVDALVGELSPGEKTLVAVARVLDRGVTTLFVDESTSTLPPAHAKRVTTALAQAARNGACIVIVTHKLAEILDCTDRVVVLIDGVVAEDARTSDLNREALVNLLVAHDTAARDESPPSTGPALLTFEDVAAERVGPINLTLRAGEILGLTGRPGSGLHDIALLASGFLKPTSGRIIAHGDLRTAFVPPHRESQGGFLDLDVRTNMSIASLKRYVRGGLIRRQSEARDVAEMATQLDVRPSDSSVQFGSLSGGNKQKVVFGRALLKAPNLVVLCEPTRGVDIGTRADIYALIHKIATGGAAVLIATSDAEDLFAVCMRIGIVDDGQISTPKTLNELSLSQIEEMV